MAVVRGCGDLRGDGDLPVNAWWRRVSRGGSEWPERGLAVFTVIHVSGEAKALEQSDLALSCGAGGLFLINHAMGVDELLDVYGAVREAVGAEAFVGINPLGGDPVEVVRDAIGRGFASLFDGLWTDNAGIDESAEKIEALADASPGLPLAIASGITPENVPEIAQRADAVLVATGISHDFEHLDPERVKALARAASALLPKEAVGSPEVSEGADQA